MRLWPALPLGSTITWKDGHKTEVGGAGAPAPERIAVTSVLALPVHEREHTEGLHLFLSVVMATPQHWRDRRYADRAIPLCFDGALQYE